MLTRQAAERIAGSIHIMRPDWPAASILTLITRDLASWPLLDLYCGLAYVAAEQNLDGTWRSKTPARVKEDGPWRRVGTNEVTTKSNPKPDETCPKHEGMYARNCGACRADKLADRDPEPIDYNRADIRTGLSPRDIYQQAREQARTNPTETP